jgi:tRNA/tmRNA/rRNA uracil-C5-methylase (TrmA/RlmC/RlmD family)
VALKAEMIADAFGRLGRIGLPSFSVAASPQRAYRMRARLHARSGAIGFYREGSHDVCDAAGTGQLSDAAIKSGVAALESLMEAGDGASVVISENVAADERALYIELSTLPADIDEAAQTAAAVPGVTGCTVYAPNGTTASAGIPAVSDPLSALTAGRAASGRIQRRPASFFQANRFLLPSLVTAVMDHVPADGELLDLYAGVGLFSISLAAAGRRRWKATARAARI